jgi:hypothetical protein
MHLQVLKDTVAFRIAIAYFWKSIKKPSNVYI